MSRHEIRCTDVAHERLVKSGLAGRLEIGYEVDGILENPAARRLAKSYASWLASDAGVTPRSRAGAQLADAIAWQRSSNQCLNGRTVMDAEEIFRSPLENARGLVKRASGAVATVLLDEKTLAAHKKSGFPRRALLEQAATAYALACQTELRLDDGDEWYSYGRRTCVGNNIHGDLNIEQADADGKLRVEETLWGPQEDFAAISEAPARFASCHNDWTPLLVAALRYAQATGRADIPEIARWKEAYQPGGHKVADTAEAYGSGMERMHARWALERLPRLTGAPGRHMGLHDMGSFHAPVLRDGNLVFLAFSETGDDRVFTPDGRPGVGDVTFGPDDLPRIMRACFGHFGRNPAMLPAILEAFDAERAA